jgi:hypothetical protein
MQTADLVLLPWIEARRRLGDRAHALRVLTPPYPAIGGGELRVLRVRETDDEPLDVVCGYERYRRP